MLGLQELRELQVPDFTRTAKTELTDGPDLPSVRDAQRHRLQLIGQPTYSLLSVTGQTKNLHERPKWSFEGKGMAFGSVVHRSIELMGKGLIESDLEAAVHVLASEEGLATEYILDAVRIVRTILSSELWKRSMRARRRLFELPLLLRKSSDELKSFNRYAAEYILPEAAAASTGEDTAVKQVFLRGGYRFFVPRG